ncbi:MAG: GGDEF domain-containing protein [Pseudorhodoplanes sp.]
MALQGPLVVIGGRPAPALSEALGIAGAFPIIEAVPADATEVIAAADPQAILIGDEEAAADRALGQVLEACTIASPAYLPVFACVAADTPTAFAPALTVSARCPAPVLAERLAAAARVRTLHLTVSRRIRLAQKDGAVPPDLPPSDPLEDATVIVAGRGRTYPALSTAIGERAGLIGALRIETAASYLKARDIDGFAIGDGFGFRNVDAMLTVLAEEARFRDLPIAVLGGPERAAGAGGAPLVQAQDPATLVARFLPYVRLRACEQRLKRILASLDRDGRLDPQTGLLFADAFMRELHDAIAESGTRGTGLSLARFVFEEPLAPRAGYDAARLVSRLIRGIDFACRDDDNTILVAFTETDLRQAHIVARRIASVLKHTMLSPDDRRRAGPTVALASRKSTDNPASLLARVTPATAAAE